MRHPNVCIFQSCVQQLLPTLGYNITPRCLRSMVQCDLTYTVSRHLQTDPRLWQGDRCGQNSWTPWCCQLYWDSY